MIECQHKCSLPILNLGVTISMCAKYQVGVNDDICSQCKDRCGEGGKPSLTLDFPQRSEQEIATVYAICQKCPLFNQMTKQCSKLKTFGHPTDVYAQNPANHCPEGAW